ncbi:hypothetical protein JCM21531_2973 [Acetivibrio straminisolvens JCM 21531]|uniref:Uncharacterized protein n=1 Tax=Acetivibrio straminisolvens JCM 21531 TaxID=1294263 RepID=W4V8G6_9FIRM|nr:hypothetical protein JCM21531_2973 [Acetivibrio straminisolvens JCM 21531]
MKIVKEILSWTGHILLAIVFGLSITIFVLQLLWFREFPWSPLCITMTGYW